MSLLNTTIWATVSMSTIKATPIWQEKQDSNGRVSEDKYVSVIRAALHYLGHDTNNGNYTQERNVNIRSNENNRIVYAKTTLFTFPVRRSYPFKRVYENCDILHIGNEEFSGWGSSHIKMEDFGNDHDPSRDDGSDF